MLSIYCPDSVEDIPPGSGHLLPTFSLIRAIRAACIFVLEFSKDSLADLGDKFSDGASANQPVILQGGVSLSSGQGYCQYQSNFLWLPEIGD